MACHVTMTMDLGRLPLAAIREFDSSGAWAAELASGQGEAHVHVVRMTPGGVIGPHVAGFCQMFVVLSGTGWVAGGDGARHALEAGHAAVIARGELHSKGADSDLTGVIVQVTDLTFHAMSRERAERSPERHGFSR